VFKETPPSSIAINHENLSEAEEKAFGLLKTRYEKAAIDMAKFEKVAGYGEARVKRDRERSENKKRDNRFNYCGDEESVRGWGNRVAIIWI